MLILTLLFINSVNKYTVHDCWTLIVGLKMTLNEDLVEDFKYLKISGSRPTISRLH